MTTTHTLAIFKPLLPNTLTELCVGANWIKSDSWTFGTGVLTVNVKFESLCRNVNICWNVTVSENNSRHVCSRLF